MNNKLKWLLCLFILGGAAAFLFQRSKPFTKPAQPPPASETTSVPKNGTIVRMTPAVSPAATPTKTLVRFPDATLMESQEARDLLTGEPVVVEVVQVDAKYPYIRVETRFSPNGVENTPPRVIESVADQVLVKASAQLPDAELLRALSAVEGRIVQTIRADDSKLFIVGLPNPLPHTVPDAVATLSAMPQVIQHVEPHFVSRAQLTPNDGRYGEQWAVSRMQLERAWDIQQGSNRVVVAVLDTGVDYNHPELQGRIWQNRGEIAGNLSDDDLNGFMDDWRGIDFVNGDSDPYDDFTLPNQGNLGHGTFVSGVIAAIPNNAAGIAGICWNVSIMPVKIIGRNGLLYTFDEIQGMDYAGAEGAHIVNMSLGGVGWSRLESEAVTRLQNRGVLVTAAAGNDGGNNDVYASYPASYTHPNIISVGFSDVNDSRDPYSNYGKISVDLFAPGREILSLAPNNGYRFGSGSSYSAPQVAGVAALLKAQNLSWSFVQLKNAILGHVDYFPSMANTCVTGGRLNAFESLIPKTSLPTALESGALVWQTGGQRKWYGQTWLSHDGVDAGASGNIAENQASWLQTTVTGPGRLSFWWKVSSEADFDFFEFIANGAVQDWIDGEVDWTEQVWDLLEGTYTLRWKYGKDDTISGGLDKAFLDQVRFRPDTAAPVVQITSPTDPYFVGDTLDLAGTATDEFELDSVQYRIENSFGATPWQSVTPNPELEVWTLNLTGLPAGTNLVRIRATDYFGRVGSTSRVFTRLFPLQVDVDGCGSVPANFAGTTLRLVGRTLNITATPCEGHLFTEWTRNNGDPVASPTISIPMEEGLHLTAHFATNQFTTLVGKYNGLFYENTGVLPYSSGYIYLTVADAGTFNGTLICDGKTNVFSGQFNATNGTANVVVARGAKGALNLALQLDFTGSQRITGIVAGSTWQASLLADRSPFSAAQNPSPFQGRYTFVLPGSLDSTASPGGSTFGAVLVNAGGKVTLQGRTADHKAIAQNASISEAGDWPLYVPLFGDKAVLLGWMKFVAPPDLTNDLVSWVRLPVAGSKWYPDGFTNDVTAAGSAYVYTAGKAILNWTNGLVILSGGDLTEPVTNTVRLGNANRLVDTGVHTTAFSLNTTNGTFSGTFTISGTTRAYQLYGAVLQNLNIGLGYYAGTNSVGEVRLQAAE